jgi:peptide/nickel transport system substrate-binding protein
LRTITNRIMKGILTSGLCALMLTTSVLLIPATDASAADEVGTLRVAVLSDAFDLNMFNLASNSYWKTKMYSWAFEGMAGVDQNGLPYPLLAEGWTFDEDTLTLTVDLREGVVFHDGVLLTAADVEFTYLVLRSGTTCSGDIIPAFDQDQDGQLSVAEMEYAVEATGEYEVTMRLSAPYGQFFSRTLAVPIIPQHVWAAHITNDYIVDVQYDDPRALTGTGPFAYDSGVDGDYRNMNKSDLYWGKDFATPMGYRTYPPNVDLLHFDVVGDFDSAIASLQADQVDYIASPIPATKLQPLQDDPAIGIEYMADSGYFYLGFNEKLEPFGSLLFRKAVAHLIDKDMIVDDFMGGLGIAGTSCMPPYYGDWYNEGVTGYEFDDPEDDTTTVPEDLLDLAGFVDINGDGWRDLPDGTVMDQIAIMGPPADYDPIRTNTIMMVAENMRAVGIDAVATPVDFDTLVDAVYTMEYQMIIMGWRFSSDADPVGVVFDILGPLSSSNYFGFWSLENPNPYYEDLLGVSTLADDETQALANQVLGLGEAARSTMDIAEQMTLTKDAQTVIHDAVPVDVLYYRVIPEAYRVEWTGWVTYMGELLNMFSLSQIERAIAPIEGSLTVDRLQGPPPNSAVGFSLEPAFDGTWTATVENDGLSGLIVDVYDVSSGEAVAISSIRLYLGSEPAGTVDIDPMALSAGGEYEFVLTPLGSSGNSARLTWTYSA